MVDAQGRLFGRWNLFDAVVALLLLGLIPLGYGAYILFRTPTPVLTAIEPAKLVQGPNLRVVIRGRNLRPYLRVSFGTVQGATFQFEDTTKAVVELNPMEPGTYDVVLYDYGQERSRLPQALSIAAPVTQLPQTHVLVAGRFINLSADDVKRVQAGVPAGFGEIKALGPPSASMPRVLSGGLSVEVPAPSLVHLPALVRIGCAIRTLDGQPECGGATFLLRVNAIMGVPMPSGPPLSFQIDNVRGDQPVETAQVRIRFSGIAAPLQLMKPGEIDTTLANNPLDFGARIVALEPLRTFPDHAERDAVLSVRAQRTVDGWRYAAGVLRVAGSFMMRTPNYEALGTIMAVSAESKAEQ